MLARTLFAAATAATLGFASVAFAAEGPDPSQGPWGNGPYAMEPLPPAIGPVIVEPEFSYPPVVGYEPGYVIEQDYNTGFMLRDPIQRDLRNQRNSVNQN